MESYNTFIGCNMSFQYTVKPEYSDHSRDQNKPVAMDRWSLYRTPLYNERPEQNLIIFGRYRHFIQSYITFKVLNFL